MIYLFIHEQKLDGYEFSHQVIEEYQGQGIVMMNGNKSKGEETGSHRR